MESLRSALPDRPEHHPRARLFPVPEFPKLQDITQPPRPPELWDVFLDPSRPMFWLIYGGLILFCLGLVLILWSRSGAGRKAPPQLPLTPQTDALRRLADIEALASTLSPLDLGNRVSGVLRQYLHRTEGVLANYRTTDEIVGHIDPAHGHGPPPLPHLVAYGPLLRRCDSLKYGGAGTSPAGRAALVRDAMDCVSGKSVVAPAPPQAAPSSSSPVPEPPSGPVLPLSAPVDMEPVRAVTSVSVAPPAAARSEVPVPPPAEPSGRRRSNAVSPAAPPAHSRDFLLPAGGAGGPPPVILAPTSVIPY